MLSLMLDYKNVYALEVSIGGISIGGKHPVCIQSMTSTNTMDTEATVAQVMRLAEAGCEMVRITAQGVREAENLAVIKEHLHQNDIDIPLIADIHFNPKAAEVAAQIVEKVRINPGNYVDRNKTKTDYSDYEYAIELEKIRQRLSPLIEICKSHNTAIRIGTNHGSLSDRILSRYGNTPAGMVASAMEFVQICQEADFNNLVLSMKASNVNQMVEANLLLVERMLKQGVYYPIHLGVTEAGDGEDGRIKSAAGIGSLLAAGIGDTIRVSLTEEPEAEIPVAKKLVSFYGIKAKEAIKANSEQWFVSDAYATEKALPLVITSDFSDKADAMGGQILTSEESDQVVYKLSYPSIDMEDLLIRTAVDFKILAEAKSGGLWLDNAGRFSPNEIADVSFGVLQALGLRISKTEYIACPSCGRTLFNIVEQLERVRQETSHLKGLKIAVMGCIVNGPGEMADADYGYVGAGPSKVSLYKGKQVVKKNVDEADAVAALIELIKEGGDWKQQ